MSTHKTLIFGISLTVLTALTISLFLINTGCTPPKPKIDPIKEKARQDSIREAQQKEYIFELSKNWSTGYEYWKAKMYQRAISPFWTVADMDSIQRFKEVWNKLVNCYFELNNADSAQIAAEKGIKQYPDNLYLLRSLAHLYTGRDLTNEAIVIYEKIVALDPKAVDDWKKLGSLRIKNNEIEIAIQAYEAASNIAPNDPEITDILVKLYGQTGDQDAALGRLEKLRQQDPENPKHMLGLARQYFTREEFAKAEPEFRAFLIKNPEDLSALEYLAACVQNQEKYDEAINIYQAVLAKQPEHKKALCEIGVCSRFQKKFALARTSVRKALKIDPNYGYAYIVLGEIYEACADDCIAQRKNKTVYDDKLVYKLAYEQYEQATKDFAFASDAKRKMNYIKPMLPQQEDEFMNKGKTKATGSCYTWIY